MKPEIRVRAYQDSDAEAWDALVGLSPMGTLLHTRRFLSYHGDRFTDASVVLTDSGERLLGVFPAARHPGDGGRVVSHPGATFGGLVYDRALAGAGMLDAFGALTRHYGQAGFEALEYRPVPWIYHRQPAADDVYALFRAGARRTRCDLACAVDVIAGARLSSRRRRGAGKAARAGVEVLSGREWAEPLWHVIDDTLRVRHEARPVHTVDELALLADRFPEDIGFVVARLDGEVAGGVVLFHSATCSKAQYIASTEAGNAVGALDAVFTSALETTRAAGRRFFDFGTSNRESGRTLNDGLYAFKSQFGGSGVPYEFYEIHLATPNPVSP